MKYVYICHSRGSDPEIVLFADAHSEQDDDETMKICIDIREHQFALMTTGMLAKQFFQRQMTGLQPISSLQGCQVEVSNIQMSILKVKVESFAQPVEIFNRTTFHLMARPSRKKIQMVTSLRTRRRR